MGCEVSQSKRISTAEDPRLAVDCHVDFRDSVTANPQKVFLHPYLSPFSLFSLSPTIFHPGTVLPSRTLSAQDAEAVQLLQAPTIHQRVQRLHARAVRHKCRGGGGWVGAGGEK